MTFVSLFRSWTNYGRHLNQEVLEQPIETFTLKENKLNASRMPGEIDRWTLLIQTWLGRPSQHQRTRLLVNTLRWLDWGVQIYVRNS